MILKALLIREKEILDGYEYMIREFLEKYLSRADQVLDPKQVSSIIRFPSPPPLSGAILDTSFNFTSGMSEAIKNFAKKKKLDKIDKMFVFTVCEIDLFSGAPGFEDWVRIHGNSDFLLDVYKDKQGKTIALILLGSSLKKE